MTVSMLGFDFMSFFHGSALKESWVSTILLSHIGWKAHLFNLSQSILLIVTSTSSRVLGGGSEVSSTTTTAD
jgi:hypothetical protein